jgi:DNA-binding CsgD family transcriptional regulator
MKADVVAAIEACYRPAASDEAWLGSVLGALQPVLDVGSGVLALLVDASDPLRLRAWSPVQIDCPSKFTDVAVKMTEAAPPPMIDRFYRRPKPGITASQLIGRKAWVQLPDNINWMLPLGMADCIGLVCTDVTHRGCVLMAPTSRIMSVPRRRTLQLRKLAVHAATGLRLRRRLDAAPAPSSGEPRGEAILHPDGRIAHAEPDAEPDAEPAAVRDALRNYAHAVDRARGRMRRSDPDGALDLWKGLAAGRWSLIDHFDTDGRRYLVAHRNDPQLESPNALTLPERQIAGYAAMGHSNKHIAYELGLSESTVATHLGAAGLKLGVRSRADLLRLVGGIVSPDGAER